MNGSRTRDDALTPVCFLPGCFFAAQTSSGARHDWPVGLLWLITNAGVKTRVDESFLCIGELL